MFKHFLDKSDPLFICPEPETIQSFEANSNEQMLTVTYENPAVTDNSGDPITITPNEAQLDVPSTTMITVEATDSSGNTAACDITIQVLGNITKQEEC